MLVLGEREGVVVKEECVNARLETGLRVHLEKAGVVLGAEGLVGEGVKGNVVAVVVNEGGQILVQGD